MSFIAVTALFLTVATLLVIGGAIFAPFLLGLSVLALVGVLGKRGERRVRRQDGVLDGTAWRNGS